MSPSFVTLEPGKWVSSTHFYPSSSEDVYPGKKERKKETQIWLISISKDAVNSPHIWNATETVTEDLQLSHLEWLINILYFTWAYSKSSCWPCWLLSWFADGSSVTVGSTKEPSSCCLLSVGTVIFSWRGSGLLQKLRSCFSVSKWPENPLFFYPTGMPQIPFLLFTFRAIPYHIQHTWYVLPFMHECTVV
jgi:hypothetical protein